MGTLNNYYVFAEDVNDDGFLEIPSLIPMRPITVSWNEEEYHLIRWSSVDREGTPTDKLLSFHNFSDGWYLDVREEWVRQLTVNQIGSTYAFYMWDDGFGEAIPVFTIYALSGSDRQTQATEDGRFVLYSNADVIYAARLESDMPDYGFDEEYLKSSFHLIHQEWKSGETS